MFSSSSAASSFGKSIFPLVNMNPWKWVALIYAAQTLGAVCVLHLFRLDFAEVAPALMLLILGALFAMVIQRYDPSSCWGSWKWWVPVGIYALFIFSLSNRSYPEAQAVFSTRLFHPFEYLTLGIFLSCACYHLMRLKGPRFFFLTVQISGILYGISDELHQAFIPGRTARFSDVCIDSLSVAFGMGLFWIAGHARRSMR